MALPDKSTGPMPNKPATPANSTKKTSASGPHGGGTPYHQAKVSNSFGVQTPITGHTQQGNVKKP
jgi:hypothetical protein